MTAKSPTKAPTKAPAKRAPTKAEDSTPSTRETSKESRSDHPAAQGIPLPQDPSAVRLQEEQDELQQPGRVSKAVADQVDNDPGYSKDQLAHMKEYWSHGDAVGEEVTDDDEGESA